MVDGSRQKAKPPRRKGRQKIVREQPAAGSSRPKKHRVKKTGMSAETFARLYRARTPLDGATARHIAANLAALNQGPMKSYRPLSPAGLEW